MDIDALAHLFAPFSGKTLLVGFSGGADSTAALLVTHAFQQRFGFALAAVHMNHHLRGDESDHEAAEAAAFARKLGVEFVPVDLNIAPGGNLEARARSARLQAWHTLQERYPDMTVVTGHHRDDRVENLLLRLGRGCNVSGLTALQARGVVENIPFLRPLFSWSRRQVETFLRQQGVSCWAQDSSNDELFTQRNILRRRILPEFYRMLPGGEKAVARSLEMLLADAACLDAIAREKFQQGDLRQREFWCALPEALFFRVLQLRLEIPPPRQAADCLRRLLLSGRDGGCEFSPQHTVTVRGGTVSFDSGVGLQESAPPPQIWHWRQEPRLQWGNWILRAQTGICPEPKAGAAEAWFALADLPEKLVVMAPPPGAKMLPFGRASEEKLKKLRVDRRISAAASPPAVMLENGTVIWFPLIRHSGHFPVTAGMEALHLQVEKIG